MPRESLLLLVICAAACADEPAVRVVQENRTESLDASHDQILQNNLVLPKHCGIVDEFAKHCNAVAKRLEEDPATKVKRYVYLKLSADHFRHAFNYEAIARSAFSSTFLTGWLR